MMGAMDVRIPINAEIVNHVAELDYFRGAWASGTLLPPDRLARLKEATRIQSVSASCRMSGIRVSDAEVAAVLRGETSPVREGVDILGYAEALARPFPAEGPIVSTEEIRRLHAVMLGAPGNPPVLSSWRDEPLHLEAFDADGKAVGRIFQTLPPRMIAGKTEDLATWLELELRSRDHHPLLVIASFVLAFLAASPFERGNARLGRLLAVHLLRRAGYTHLSYASFERVMEEMRDQYHDALDAAETRLWTGEADISPWLAFFLQALRRQTERVQAKVGLERQVLELSALQRTIVDTVREHGAVGAALLLAATGANRNTLKDNLRRLVQNGVLVRSGKLRGSLYRLATGEPPVNAREIQKRDASRPLAPVSEA